MKTHDHDKIVNLMRRYRKAGTRFPEALKARWHAIQSEEGKMLWERRKRKLAIKVEKQHRLAQGLPTSAKSLERLMSLPIDGKAIRATFSDPKYDEFYKTYEWRHLRYLTIKRFAQSCMACGGKPPSVVLNVDHIVPIRLDWSRRLDPENLNILCEPCNHGKGNRDQTDWRPVKITEPEDFLETTRREFCSSKP